MSKMALNYATFYQSAIKGLTSLSQTDVVNVLFLGTTADDYLGTPISTSMGSHLAKGRTQVPKKLRTGVWECSCEDLVDRLKLLEIQSIDNCYRATVRLIQVCGVTDAAMKNLARDSETVDDQYIYIAEAFTLCTKCPKKNISVLTDGEIELLRQLQVRDVPELVYETEEPIGDAEGENGTQEIRWNYDSEHAKDSLLKEAYHPRVRVGDIFEDPENVSVREVVVTLPDEADKYIALFSDESTLGIINLDAADVCSMFSLGEDGNHEFRFFCYKGKRDAVLNRLPEVFRGRTCDGCLLYYIGGQSMGIVEINDAACIIQENAHPDAYILYGAMYSEEEPEDYAEIWLLCSFVIDTIVSRDDVARAIFESLESIPIEKPAGEGGMSSALFEEEHEIDVNEAFKDIEAIFNQRDREIRGRKSK